MPFRIPIDLSVGMVLTDGTARTAAELWASVLGKGKPGSFYQRLQKLVEEGSLSVDEHKSYALTRQGEAELEEVRIWASKVAAPSPTKKEKKAPDSAALDEPEPDPDGPLDPPRKSPVEQAAILKTLEPRPIDPSANRGFVPNWMRNKP